MARFRLLLAALVLSAIELAIVAGCADSAAQSVPDGLWVQPGKGAAPRVSFVRDDLYGYLDEAGRVALPPQYEWADDYRGGFGLCKWKGTGTIIDESGSTVGNVPASAETYFRADVDRVWYTIGGKWGLCDLAGNVLVKPIYDDADAFSDSLARVNIGAVWEFPGYREGGKNGYIDRAGQLVIPCEIEGACFEFHNGYARVENGFIDRSGKAVLDGPWLGYTFSEGLTSVCDYGTRSTKYIDIAGNDQFSVDGLGEEFSDGLALVRHNQQIGFIDRRGRYVIQRQFVDAQSFQNRLAGVSKARGRWGFIDTKGTLVTPTHFNEVKPAEERYAIVHYGGERRDRCDAPSYWLGGRWLMIDRSGQSLAVVREDGADR